MSLRILDALEDQPYRRYPRRREVTDPSGHVDRCRPLAPRRTVIVLLYKDELEVIGNTEAQLINGQVDQTNGGK